MDTEDSFWHQKMDPKYSTKTSLGEIFDPGKLITFGFLEGNTTTN